MQFFAKWARWDGGRLWWLPALAMAGMGGLLLAANATGAEVPVFYAGNKGQAGEQTRFIVRTTELSAELQPASILFSWRGQRLQLEFIGANAEAPIEGLHPFPGQANYFLGKDPGAWITGVSLFGSVRYRDLYPGIDMVYGGSGRHIKSDFIVAPGVDPALIRMRYTGAQEVRIDSGGSLVVSTAQGQLREKAPDLYQWVGGNRVAVDGSFRMLPEGEVGFTVGNYDATLVLWIDPTVSYSTYIGGSRVENATSTAVDSSGNLFVAGWTESTNFPTASPLRVFGGSVDAFVMKMNSLGTGLLYATFLGGSGDDRAYGIDIDPSGNAYVAGYTTSFNFPVVSAVQSANGGGRDVFAVKLNATGSAIVYSTYLGGSGNDIANGAAVDPYGQIYVAGETDSNNFPTRFPFQSSKSGLRDAFAFKLNMSGALSFSTYMGGNGDDRATAIAISPVSLTPYITGCTQSTNFPTWNASQPSNAGGQDAFVVRFNGDANALVYSTYLGGSGGSSFSPECGYAVALDSYNNAYVTGVTPSINFPIIAAFQTTYGGGSRDGFFTKLNSGGVRLNSSYLGGRGIDVGTSIRADSSRRAYIAGYTSSHNLFATAAVQTTIAGGYDAFFMRVEVDGLTLGMSSYLGGAGTDSPLGIAYHSDGDLYLVGLTNSLNFPKQAPFQTVFGGSVDAFLTKVSGVSF
ncbi:MAG: SBBP repeat-containing protein [Acidobacteriia bacterium]|nr:SBBP repeat-containing protein [Terriglobia bacterium]